MQANICRPPHHPARPRPRPCARTPTRSRHRPSCARQVVLLGRGGLLCRARPSPVAGRRMWQVGAQAERFGCSKLRCPEEGGLASSSQQFSATSSRKASARRLGRRVLGCELASRGVVVCVFCGLACLLYFAMFCSTCYVSICERRKRLSNPRGEPFISTTVVQALMLTVEAEGSFTRDTSFKRCVASAAREEGGGADSFLNGGGPAAPRGPLPCHRLGRRLAVCFCPHGTVSERGHASSPSPAWPS